MQRLTVYDPPMCCATGVCGPEIDPKLVQFAGDLDWLKSQGIEVERINLAQEPGRFVANAAVKAILDQSGGDDLPAIVLGDALLLSGRYPDRSELAALLGLPTVTVAARREGSTGGCCSPKEPTAGEQKSTGCC